jgi:hypothetical protein
MRYPAWGVANNPRFAVRKKLTTAWAGVNFKTVVKFGVLVGLG